MEILNRFQNTENIASSGQPADFNWDDVLSYSSTVRCPQ